MKKNILLLILSSTLITLSLFCSFLLVDDLFLLNKFFGSFSNSSNNFFVEKFGSFGFLTLSFFLILGISLVIPFKFFSKIVSVSGYFLLVAFFISFFTIVKINGVYSGTVGVRLAKMFTKFGGLSFLIHFLWFFLSIFLILFPFRKIISNIIILITSFFNKSIEAPKKQRKEVIKNEKVVFENIPPKQKHEKKSSVPFLSKVVYENTNNRLEIPIFSNNEKIKKFKLKDNEIQEEKYEEVDTFSEIPIKEEPEEKKDLSNEEKYFQKIKESWPSHWKNAILKEEKNLSSENMEDNYTQRENLVELEVIDEDDYIETSLNLIEEKRLQFLGIEALQKQTEDIEELSDIEEANLDEYQENNPQYEDLEEIEENSEPINNYFPQKVNFKTNFILEEDTKEKIFLPKSDILTNAEIKNFANLFKAEERESAIILEQTLLEFGIKADVCEIIHGPVVTLFKLIPAPGVKLSRIEGLSTNLALRLAAQSIRIIAPIPGEKVVGIEIPNRKRELVSFKEIANSEEFIESKYNIPIGLGKDIYGKIIVVDLYKMPHILIAGATGSGKSVCVNCFLCSILFSKTPEDLKLLLIDPKIVELKPYNNIPHLLTPVITESKEALNGLKYLLYEMERRYSLLDEMGVRDIVDYQKARHTKKTHLEHLPFIVAFVDEFADLMTTSGKEAEILFARLAAKARAVGILLVLATQRPSADVITGLIKANVPARIAFQVISLQDSRIILDQKGAEKLLGQGDMLYLSPSQPFPIRLQGAFLSKEEVDSIADHWKNISAPQYIDINELIGIAEEEEDEDFNFDGENKDPLFDQAMEIVYQTKKASASYLQRRLNIGYNRAARMVEEMETRGIVGPQRGAKAREVIGLMSDR